MLTQQKARTLHSGPAHSLAFPPSPRLARSLPQPLRCHRLARMPRRRSSAATVRALAGPRKLEQVGLIYGAVAEPASASDAMKWSSQNHCCVRTLAWQALSDGATDVMDVLQADESLSPFLEPLVRSFLLGMSAACALETVHVAAQVSSRPTQASGCCE